MKQAKRIAILGGGPAGLFVFKRLIEAKRTDLIIDVFEKKKVLGAGMPYDAEGAGDEHITNVSGNEIPRLVTGIAAWIKTVSPQTLERFKIDLLKFDDYHVLPRLLFGDYLSAQFNLLRRQALKAGIEVNVHLDSHVIDVIDQGARRKVVVEVAGRESKAYDQVIICTGHKWPIKNEGIVPGFFDSPYPPSKLARKINHAIGIKGSSLTAIDAIRTLARHNGTFKTRKNGELYFKLSADSPNFKLVMHSRSGLLPSIRFHLEDPHLLKDSVLSKDEVERNRAENEGFLSLDFIFEKNFKNAFIKKRPSFYAKIKEMQLEDFVEEMMNMREQKEAFQLFRSEYLEAERSIENEESIYWKEMLAVLSFAMNYPAKYFSAEDTLRLQKVLMPLISIVIAFVPQSSVAEMLALHAAGVLDIVAVGDDSTVEPHKNEGAIYKYSDGKGIKKTVHFKTYVDCVGQPHLSDRDLPFPSLTKGGVVCPARIKFREVNNAIAEMKNGSDKVVKETKDTYYLKVPGITINDHFQVVNTAGKANTRIYIMAVPYIGGYNPDYSGLDFCEAASAAIAERLLSS